MWTAGVGGQGVEFHGTFDFSVFSSDLGGMDYCAAPSVAGAAARLAAHAGVGALRDAGDDAGAAAPGDDGGVEPAGAGDDGGRAGAAAGDDAAGGAPDDGASPAGDAADDPARATPRLRSRN